MSKDLQSALGTVITDATTFEDTESKLKLKDSPDADFVKDCSN